MKARTSTLELPATQRQVGDLKRQLMLEMGRALDDERRDRRTELLSLRSEIRWHRRLLVAGLLCMAGAAFACGMLAAVCAGLAGVL